MEVNRDKVLKLQRACVETMRARQAVSMVTQAGLEFEVGPGVFPPYLDSELVRRAMRIESDELVLEVGAGCG
ncbi:MAG: hypothetical protein ACR2NZ_00750, partial [Rubripirellula sp.]